MKDAVDGSINRVRATQAARDWLTRGGYEFKRVCEMAGLEPEAVADRAKLLIANHDNRHILARYRERVAQIAV